MKSESYIARRIVEAQIASDAGKRKDYLFDVMKKTSRDKRAHNRGYADKDVNILQAITAICERKDGAFHFYVCHTTLKNGTQCYLAYFNFKVDGKRYQASFHCFSKKLECYVSSKSVPQTWDKRSSREACYILSKKFGFSTDKEFIDE